MTENHYPAATTDEFVAFLRDNDYKVTNVIPGSVAANNGRFCYRFDQTMSGWNTMRLGRMW